MRFRGLAFLSFLLGLVSFSAPARAAWIEGTTQHFTFYGDVSPEAMRRFAERLERYDAALRIITRATESSRVNIYFLPTMGDVQALYGHRGSVGGYYSASAQDAHTFVPLTDSSQGSQYGVRPIQILYHEYAHHMLLGNLDQSLPGWASEGMAELFMTVQFGSDGSLTFGAPSLNRGFGVMASDRFSLQDLLLSDTRRLAPEQVEQKYSRGWLLVHYLLLSGNRSGQFSRFITLLNRPTPVLDAAREAFGDLGVLNAEFDRYRLSPHFRGFRVTAQQLGPTPQVTIRTMRPGEAAIMPYRMRSVNGVNREQALQLIGAGRRIAAQYPDDVFVQRSLAEMEFDANNLAESEAAADRALALDANNVMAMVYKARVIGRRAYVGGNEAGWREARSWLLRANRLDSNFALPLVLYYDSFVAAHQPARRTRPARQPPRPDCFARSCWCRRIVICAFGLRSTGCAPTTSRPPAGRLLHWPSGSTRAVTICSRRWSARSTPTRVPRQCSMRQLRPISTSSTNSIPPPRRRPRRLRAANAAAARDRAAVKETHFSPPDHPFGR
jgi:hypothetical protein